MQLSMSLLLLLVCKASCRNISGFPDFNSTCEIGGVVQTDSGPVCGHPASRASQVSEYLGIPFAQPPLGNLRFAPPQKYFGNSTINGTDFGFSCPISSTYSRDLIPSPDAGLNFTAAGTKVLNVIAQLGDRFSEDCLTLNVWTKPQIGEARKAVMVWLYGGGFIAGNSNAPTYNGARFAEQEDVVIVSVNYRLNIFGFPGIPGSNNLGLLDQRLAIEWVRDNIAAFGGDPARITIFGESAGGGSVDFYSYAWTSDPIVAGFIAQSGTTAVVPPNDATKAQSLWFNASFALGCGNADSDADQVLRCMREKDVSDIVDVISKLDHFVPTVDEQIVFSDYNAQSLAGNVIKKPMMIGYTDNEAGMVRIVAGLKGITLPDSYWDQMNRELFICPASVRANVNVYHDIPIWRYRYFGDFENMRLSSTIDTGAYHGAEVNVLFDTVPEGEGIPDSNLEQVEFGSYMRGAWAAFAKDPEHGLESFREGWPQFNPSEDTLIRLGYENQSGVNLGSPSEYDFGCDSIFPI